jgi:hypothetical protein
MTFNQWLDTFIEEKGIDTNHTFEVEGNEYGTNLIPVGVVIEHIKIAPKHEKDQIKNILVKIDFHNGDVLDFLNHLAKALAI